MLGYRIAATTENAFVTSKSNPYLVPRFSVADEISFPEAICNMVGVWRPVIDPMIYFLGLFVARPPPVTRHRQTSVRGPPSLLKPGSRSRYRKISAKAPMSLLLSTSSLAVCSFVLALLLTPLLRDLALRRGWVDEPDNHRKLHKGPIPRIGGIAIVLAYVGSFSLLLSFHVEQSAAIQNALPLVAKLLPAVAVVFATGLLDDCIGLKPWQKLLGVSFAAALACLGDIQIHGIAYHPLHPYVGIPLTIIWLVGCANAFNLIDGVDGVATGLGLLATLTTLGAALWHGDTGLVMATVPLAGALLGFLRFNFNPASVFLGDCGSLTIGFLLGCCAVIWSHKAVTLLGMTAPLMALSVPLLDMSLAIVRRLLLLRPIFSADRGHIHHRLSRSRSHTTSCRTAAIRRQQPRRMLRTFQCAVTDAGLPVTILFCGVVWMAVQFLRYHEFGIVGRFLRENNVRSMVKFHCWMHS